MFILNVLQKFFWVRIAPWLCNSNNEQETAKDINIVQLEMKPLPSVYYCFSYGIKTQLW